MSGKRAGRHHHQQEEQLSGTHGAVESRGEESEIHEWKQEAAFHAASRRSRGRKREWPYLLYDRLTYDRAIYAQG